TLRKRIKGGPVPVIEALDTAIQIAGALEAAHHAGIVHRDVKPENVMLRKDGYVKVLDFELARPTEQHEVSTEAATLVNTEIGMIVGTASYMSPEQARGQRVDARSDIFSLGMVIYEMLAGRSPFIGATNSDIVASILKEDPPRLTDLSPDIPADLERIVNRALTKDKDARYQTVAELLSDLKRLKQNLDFETQKDSSVRADSQVSGGAVTAAMPARAFTADHPPAKSTSASAIAPVFVPRRHRARNAILIVLSVLALVAY